MFLLRNKKTFISKINQCKGSKILKSGVSLKITIACMQPNTKPWLGARFICKSETQIVFQINSGVLRYTDVL